jgi:uncharacterized membrane protein (Fun14 family)
MDKDFWVVTVIISLMVIATFAYLNSSGYIQVDWNWLFNIKTYPK